MLMITPNPVGAGFDWADPSIKTILVLLVPRPVITENTTHMVAKCQHNILLIWHAILNHLQQYFGR